METISNRLLVIRNNPKNGIALFLYAGLGLLSYYLFRQQAMSLFPSDLSLHLPIIDDFIGKKYSIPHPGFHLLVYALSKAGSLPYSHAAPIIMTIVLLLTIRLTHKGLKYYIGDKSFGSLTLLLVAIALNFVIAIYLPFFNSYPYVGQWSPNIWHNPQMLLMKPLALVAFFYYISFLNQNGNLSSKELVLLSGVFLAGVIMKPSFVFVFFPTAGLLLIFCKKEFGSYIKSFFMFLPSLAMLLYQYTITYQSTSSQSHYHDQIILTNFGVLKLYTPSVTISTLLVLAFPISVLACCYRQAIRSIYLKAAWMLTVVSFFQFAFLAEKQKFEQGAFGFGYVIALHILYVVSMCEYLKWHDNKSSALQRSAVPLVFSLHLVSGIYYFIKLLKGGTYY